MSSDLISRSDLFDKIFHNDYSPCEVDENAQKILTEVLRFIRNAPDVDHAVVAQVNFDGEKLKELVDDAKAEVLASIKRTKGEWLETNELIGTHLHPVLKCSVCGSRAVDKLNFCPDCGADMRKEE